MFGFPPALIARAWGATSPPDSLAEYRLAGPLTLDLALRLTAERHPRVAASLARVRSTEALGADAGRPPNPTLAGGIENFGGGLGSNRRETTLELEQVLELGGDRNARRHLARSEVMRGHADFARTRRDELARTAEAFVEAWAAQERARQLRSAEELAGEAVSAAGARHRAGATPEVERVRAEAARTLRATERRRAESASRVARMRLASQLGLRAEAIDSLALPDPHVPRLPQAELLLARVMGSPEQLQAAAESALAEGRVRVAVAGRVPDVSIRAGARRLEEVGGTGFVAGVSVPLPLWGTLRNSLPAARTGMQAAHLEQQAARAALREQVFGAREEFRSAIAAYDTLREQVRPATEEALRLIGGGYRSGRFSYLDLLEAQRSLLESDLALIDATADVWRARTVLEQLIGAPLNRMEDR